MVIVLREMAELLNLSTSNLLELSRSIQIDNMASA